MSNIYLMCDNCGIETNGITFVNGMKFCAKCYHQIFGKDNQQTEITQLKQQLEESFTEEDVEGLIEDRNKTIKFLQQQLAEKDKEISKLQASCQQFKTQLAIQELEEIINIFEPYENANRDTILELNNNISFIDYIEQRIKELKGE